MVSLPIFFPYPIYENKAKSKSVSSVNPKDQKSKNGNIRFEKRNVW